MIQGNGLGRSLAEKTGGKCGVGGECVVGVSVGWVVSGVGVSECGIGESGAVGVTGRMGV